MQMTFDQYIQNPMGVANSVISNREMYRNMYTMKIDVVMVREMGKLNYHLYEDGDKYYAYIKVPSEVIEKFYYDVLIEFTPPNKKVKQSKTLKEYNVRFYSNDPAFVFTFAHAFIKNKIFITEYTDKMSKEAVKNVAKQKNPRDTVGYVKSLFFAYLLMQRFGMFNKIKYTEKYNIKYLKQMIMPADQKIALRTEAGQEVSTKQKRAKKVASKINQQKEEKIPPKSVSSKRTSNIRTTSKVGTTGRTKTTKRTNKIGKK